MQVDKTPGNSFKRRVTRFSSLIRGESNKLRVEKFYPRGKNEGNGNRNLNSTNRTSRRKKYSTLHTLTNFKQPQKQLNPPLSRGKSANHSLSHSNFFPTANEEQQRKLSSVSLPATTDKLHRQMTQREYRVAQSRAKLLEATQDSISNSLNPNQQLLQRTNKIITKQDAKRLSNEFFKNHFDDDTLTLQESLRINQHLSRKVQNPEETQIERILLVYTQKGDETGLHTVIKHIQESHNLNVNYNRIRDNKGCNLLQIAAAKGLDAAIICFFGYTNIDIEHKNNYGYSALSIACHYGNLRTVQLLLDFGADSNSRNSDGENSLIVAANRILKYKNNKIYEVYLLICKEIIERCDTDVLYTKEDKRTKKIRNNKTRMLVEEWIQAKKDLNNLHVPPIEVINAVENETSNRFKEFLLRKNKAWSIWDWLKILVLLVFVAYDMFMNGFSHNIWIYLCLYIAAYFL
eukprot:snap_masked-scaffold_19-processed-gene-5.14-mRNA-1 protein AED:1.00 eAED:1.00 QI:0/-1/0/0/-1/1/1/0/460